MTKPSTSLLSGLRLVYKNYGGWHSIVSSEYFILAVFLSVLSWKSVGKESWVDTAKTVLPVLAGFSIAAYAIFFVVLDEKSRQTLSTPVHDLGNRSPLLILIASISHVVLIQVSGILYALVISSDSVPPIPEADLFNCLAKYVLSSVGLLLTIYGIVLVAGTVLSIFRLLEIRSRTDAG